MAVAAPASAGTIGISGSTLIFGADPDEQLGLTGSTSSTDLFLNGAIFDIVTPGCFANGANSVRCPLAGFTTLTIVGSLLDDAIELSGITGVNVFVAAKDGDDIVIGGRGDDVITGGKGDDVLNGGPGADSLFGGPGDNILLDGGGSLRIEPPDPEPLPAQAVPEPATMLLLGLGLGASVVRKRL
jgi:Ca2+-binding RTX toxin-like protein